MPPELQEDRQLAWLLQLLLASTLPLLPGCCLPLPTELKHSTVFDARSVVPAVFAVCRVSCTGVTAAETGVIAAGTGVSAAGEGSASRAVQPAHGVQGDAATAAILIAPTVSIYSVCDCSHLGQQGRTKRKETSRTRDGRKYIPSLASSVGHTSVAAQYAQVLPAVGCVCFCAGVLHISCWLALSCCRQVLPQQHGHFIEMYPAGCHGFAGTAARSVQGAGAGHVNAPGQHWGCSCSIKRGNAVSQVHAGFACNGQPWPKVQPPTRCLFRPQPGVGRNPI